MNFMKIQRKFCDVFQKKKSTVYRAMRTTPTRTLEIIFLYHPIEIQIAKIWLSQHRKVDQKMFTNISSNYNTGHYRRYGSITANILKPSSDLQLLSAWTITHYILLQSKKTEVKTQRNLEVVQFGIAIPQHAFKHRVLK